eukprot:7510043-Pyramimonas_sp.AAC.1
MSKGEDAEVKGVVVNLKGPGVDAKGRPWTYHVVARKKGTPLWARVGNAARFIEAVAASILRHDQQKRRNVTKGVTEEVPGLRARGGEAASRTEIPAPPSTSFYPLGGPEPPIAPRLRLRRVQIPPRSTRNVTCPPLWNSKLRHSAVQT